MAKRHGSRVNPSRNRPVRNRILRLSDSVVTVRIVLTGGRLPALPAFPERFAPRLQASLIRQSKRLPLAVNPWRFVAGALNVLDVRPEVRMRLRLDAAFTPEFE